MAKNRAKLNFRAGGEFRIREISPTPSDTFISSGYLQSSKFSDKHETAEAIDDAGNYIDIDSIGEKAIFSAKLMQTSKTEIDLKRNASGKYYDLYYVLRTKEGKYQELSSRVCKIIPGFEMEMKPGLRVIDIEVHMLAPRADFVSAPTDYNVTENVPYVLIESVAAKGEPTDTAANVATGVL